MSRVQADDPPANCVDRIERNLNAVAVGPKRDPAPIRLVPDLWRWDAKPLRELRD
jgi:hypothetical protein